MATHDAARHLWSQADLEPGDVDVAQIYDAFPPFVLFWLEALGFCGPGENGPFVEGGTRISLGGELPVNAWGGQLSGGRLHGWAFEVSPVIGCSATPSSFQRRHPPANVRMKTV